MRKFTLLSLFLLAITFIVVNCTKEGPQGPAGAIGATGGIGPTGPVGPQGPAGTANVTYSAWYTGTWKNLTTPGPDNGFSIDTFIRAAPAVTQAIMDNGVVLGYMRGSATSNILSGTQVVGLPYHDVVDDDHFKFILSKPGSIVHSYQSINPWSTDQLNLFNHSFRYVVIPGGVSGGRSAGVGGTNYTADQVRAMSYSQICSIFKIPQ